MKKAKSNTYEKAKFENREKVKERNTVAKNTKQGSLTSEKGGGGWGKKTTKVGLRVGFFQGNKEAKKTRKKKKATEKTTRKVKSKRKKRPSQAPQNWVAAVPFGGGGEHGRKKNQGVDQ